MKSTLSLVGSITFLIVVVVFTQIGKNNKQAQVCWLRIEII